MQVARLASRVQFDIQHLLRDGAALATPHATGVLQGVLQVEEHTRCRARIALVYQYRATTQKIAMAFECQVEGGIQQRMARADKGRQGLALWCDKRFLKGDALV